MSAKNGVCPLLLSMIKCTCQTTYLCFIKAVRVCCIHHVDDAMCFSIVLVPDAPQAGCATKVPKHKAGVEGLKAPDVKAYCSHDFGGFETCRRTHNRQYARTVERNHHTQTACAQPSALHACSRCTLLRQWCCCNNTAPGGVPAQQLLSNYWVAFTQVAGNNRCKLQTQLQVYETATCYCDSLRNNLPCTPAVPTTSLLLMLSLALLALPNAHHSNH